MMIKTDLYVEASRALVELKTCLSSLRSPQLLSPHSSWYYDNDEHYHGDGDENDDHGGDNYEECNDAIAKPVCRYFRAPPLRRVHLQV